MQGLKHGRGEVRRSFPGLDQHALEDLLVDLLEDAAVLGKIFVARRVFDEAIELLGQRAPVEGNATDRILTPEELQTARHDVEGALALLTDRIDSEFMDSCPNLKLVANFTVGFNNVDLAAATARGVMITKTPGVLTETTADFAWTLLMAAARRVVEGDRFVRQGKFHAWGPRMLLGHDVFEKTWVWWRWVGLDRPSRGERGDSI